MQNDKTQWQARIKSCSSSRESEETVSFWVLADPKGLTVGRESTCGIAVDGNRYPAVSRQHVTIQPILGDDFQQWQVCDLNSANGTYINGVRLQGCQTLHNGDRIQLSRDGPEFYFECQTIASNPRPEVSIPAATPSILERAENQPSEQSQAISTPAAEQLESSNQSTAESLQPGAVSTQSDKMISKPARSLWSLSAEAGFKVLNGHIDAVRAIAFSSNQTMLASAGIEKTIRLWNWVEETAIETLAGHKQTINAVAFGPENQILASGSADKTIRLWNVRTGETLQLLTGHTAAVNTLAFNADGNQLISGGADKTIRIWDVQTGVAVRSIVGHKMPVTAIAFSAVGQSIQNSGSAGIIASASTDRTIKFWNAASGEEIHSFSNRTTVHTLSFSPTGERLAIGCEDNTIRLWDVATSQEIHALPIPPWYDGGLAISSDGLCFAGSDTEHAIRIWNV